MRKQLLLSTGIICLMLAPAVSYGQAPDARGEEQKQMRPSEAGKGAASQERGHAAEQKTQGAAGREERGVGSRQTEERGKAGTSTERPATAADDKRGRGDDAKSKERAQDSRQGGRDAQTAREGKDAKDSGKGSAEMKRDSDREKSRAESDKGKEGTTAQKEREGASTTQKESGRDQRDSSKNAAEQGKDVNKDANRPSTATDTTRTQPPTNAQGQSTQQTQTSQTHMSQQSNVSVDKQVRISETLTRERLAAPERNLNISIRIGEPIPERVRVHRLPDTIVAIEPEYRDYDYFTTEEEIVIVEPRTHRIVSQIPRDASRIRAAGGASGSSTTGYTGTVAAAGGASPCRIMRRDSAGNVTELTPQTVGATAQQESISVTVRVPGGATTAPIAMGAPDGQIVVAGQSGADCTVTVEPPTR